MSGTLTTKLDSGCVSATVRCRLAPGDKLEITDEGAAGFEVQMTTSDMHTAEREVHYSVIQLTREDMQQLMCWVLARLHKTGE